MSATVSVYKSAATFSAVSNDVWWLFQSTDTSLNNFKYVLTVNQVDKISGNVTQSLGTYKIVARPTNNLGYFSPNRILNGLVDNSYPFYSGIAFNPTTISSFMSYDDTTHIKYNINYGFEYNPKLDFTQVLQVGTGSFFGLTFSTNHGLSLNDNIYISSYNQYLGGTATITQILTPTSFKINKSFTSSVPISFGSVTNAQHINGTSSNVWVYNGALQYGQDNIYQYVDNNIVLQGTASDVFLTQFDTVNYNKKKVKLSNYETLSFLLPDNFNSRWSGTVKVITNTATSSTSTILGMGTLFSSYNKYRKFIIGSGPMNLTAKGISFTNVTSYSIQILLNDGVIPANGPTFNYEIDSDCSIFNNVRLIWLNRLGGYDFFNFSQNSKRVENITRKEYKQVLKPYYTTGERGSNILNISTEQIYTVNTNWLTESDYLALNDLLTSLEAYVLDETSGKVYPIIITDTNYTQKTYYTDQVFNLTLNYKLAYEKIIQSN